MLITGAPATVFADAAAAAKVIAEMADDVGTTYEVRVDPKGSGRALIAVIDGEDGFLGYL